MSNCTQRQVYVEERPRHIRLQRLEAVHCVFIYSPLWPRSTNPKFLSVAEVLQCITVCLHQRSYIMVWRLEEDTGKYSALGMRNYWRACRGFRRISLTSCGSWDVRLRSLYPRNRLPCVCWIREQAVPRAPLTCCPSRESISGRLAYTLSLCT
jgi:hypothetical protein